MIRCDNGSEMCSAAFRIWAEGRGIRVMFIQPGKPREAGHISPSRCDLSWPRYMEHAALELIPEETRIDVLQKFRATLSRNVR